MNTVTSIFTGNAAIPYAAFNLRDPYYPEMARFVINDMKKRIDKAPDAIVDLGAGIGMSTMEILKNLGQNGLVIAVEPDEGMRYFCGLNTMSDPRVIVADGRGENLTKALDVLGWTDQTDFYRTPFRADAVLCCQAFHLFNPPAKESLVPVVLKQISEVLRSGGVFAFDLGPSNYEFAEPLADHRTGNYKSEDIMTELAHPLYQRAHAILFDVVRREFPTFERENLWPSVTARMSLEYLKDACDSASFQDLLVSEYLSPVSGTRVINFIRNGWTVFFRWQQLSELSAERKLEFMKEALDVLFKEPDFLAMSKVMSYHPTAVFTAVKS